MCIVGCNQVSELPDYLTECPRLKVLRVEENCLPLSAISTNILKNSTISLLAVDGNLFEMREFPHVDGYEEVYLTALTACFARHVMIFSMCVHSCLEIDVNLQYMERYTATKKKAL